MARRGENIRKRKDGRWERRYIKGRKPDHTAIWGYVYGRNYTAVKKELTIRKNSMYLLVRTRLRVVLHKFCLCSWLVAPLFDVFIIPGEETQLNNTNDGLC